MSFSLEVKEDLVRIVSNKECCKKAELAAILRMNGNIHFGGGGKVSLSITTENAGTARKMYTFCKDLFNLNTEILIHRKTTLKKNQVYSLHIPYQKGIDAILEMLDVRDRNNIWNMFLPSRPQAAILQNNCCKRAYLRGAFLGGGSINNPEGSYHLEIACQDQGHCLLLLELLACFEIPAKMIERKQTYLVYLKGSEQISCLLNVIGSHRSLLKFENTRIVKEVRNNVNRLVNCENANLNKTVDAGLRQVEEINLIAATMGLEKLPQALRDVAEVRLEYPDSSFMELAKLLGIGKSGVNHRMKRIAQIAEEVKNQTSGN